MHRKTSHAGKVANTLRVVAALIRSCVQTPIHALFHPGTATDRALVPSMNSPSRGVRNRRKQKVSAEAIQMMPCRARISVQEGRGIYSSCTAIIADITYEFDLVHQSGSIDENGRQQRPCWSWIQVRGPHRDRSSSETEAVFASCAPYRSLSGNLLQTRAVRQAIEQWCMQPEVREAAALAQKQEDESQCLLIAEGQRRKLQPRGSSS